MIGNYGKRNKLGNENKTERSLFLSFLFLVIGESAIKFSVSPIRLIFIIFATCYDLCL